MLRSVVQDARYTIRSVQRTPGATVAAIATLALGIGASTAMFGIASAVLVKTVPVAQPHELYFLAHGTGETPSLSANYPLVERYRALTDVFSGVTAYNVQQFKVSTPAASEVVPGQYVVGNYHEVLGVPLLLGRGFASESDHPSDDSLVAVISERFWTRAFARDPNVIGKTLVAQGKTVSIVGVTAAGFHGLRPGTQFDVTLPLAVRILDDPDFLSNHKTWTGLNTVARLKPGVTEAQALGRADAAFRQFMSEPEQAWVLRPGQANDAFRMARLLPAARGTGALRAQYAGPLRILLAMVAVFLLIACANVANLMLVRGSSRAREIAIRLAIGATRGRVIRQFMTESVLLACGGGAAGLLLSLWASSAIVALFHAGQLPIIIDVDVDWRTLAFAATVSMLSAAVFGLLPAVRSTRLTVAPTLKESSVSATQPGRRLATGRMITVCQIALCMLLLAATGVLVRTLLTLQGLERGFEKENLLLYYLDTRGTRSQVDRLYAGLDERLRALPGVRSVSFSTASPLGTDEEMRGIVVPGAPANSPASALTNRVTPTYFATVGTPIVRGRGVEFRDTATAPKVAVVSQTFAAVFFGESDPLGRTLAFRSSPTDPVTIVGVARDARQKSLREAAPPLVYLPLAQAEEPLMLLTGAIRATQPAPALEAALKETAAAYHQDLLVSYVRTMEEQMSTSLLRENVLASLSTGFGLLALTLACLGVYGVISYGVSLRAREIGIRLALGAQPATVVWRTLREAISMWMAGTVLGLIGSLIAARVLSSFVFGLSPRDPLTLFGTGIVMLLTSVLAAYVPARRAASIDPVQTLRSE